jgi:hypothetical protein
MKKIMNLKTPQTGVDVFLNELSTFPLIDQATSRGRLMFAMDATSSRQPTWDLTAKIQCEMFAVTSEVGGLSVQLAFYRGFSQFKVSQWTSNAAKMMRLMTSVSCLAGETQIYKILEHALNETQKVKVNAVVFVGDCMEEEMDVLSHLAGKLGLVGLPVFIFQEASDPIASFAFQQIAKLSGGACVQFDRESAYTLRKLLGAIAVYAAGGRNALNSLAKSQGGVALQISNQMKLR